MIYEGTNGVQAMDLVGRKLALNGGRAVQRLFALVDAECAEESADETVRLVAERLSKATGEMKAATMWFMQNAMANPNNLGAGAYAYMTLTGIVSLGLMWLRMAKVSAAADVEDLTREPGRGGVGDDYGAFGRATGDQLI